MSLSLQLNNSDIQDWTGLPEAVRDEVRLLQRCFERILQAPNKRGQIKQVASELGKSEGAIRKLFYKWEKADRHYSSLVDKRRTSKQKEDQLPPAFIDHWKLLCEQNQRSCKPAYRKLLADWRMGAEIPGYAISPRAASHSSIPKGWSYQNLMKHKPTKFELKSVRIGRGASFDERPLVYTTRRNLWLASHYMFDDMWHDHEVNLLDTAQHGRPLEFHALDLFSANKFAWGMRVRREREDGKRDSLKEADFRFLLAYVLGHIGYNAERGTQLIVEHGTAAIRDDLEQFLFDASGGLIKVARSGMDGDPAHIGQYAGRGKGNFRFKAALESLGNLIHNEMAALPGQVGLNRDNSPEQHHGLIKYNDALLAAMSQLPLEQVRLLHFPLIEFRQFQKIAGDIYHKINQRTDHKLEGWDDLYITDMRTMQVRRMSPAEVWQGNCKSLTKLSSEAIALMLGPDLGQIRKTKRSMIELTDSHISGDVIRFDATHLKPDEKYNTVLNPFCPDKLFCFDAKGRFVGALERIWSVDRNDINAVNTAMGRAAKTEAQLLEPIRKRHLAEARQKKRMHENNSRVLKGQEQVSKILTSDHEIFKDSDVSSRGENKLEDAVNEFTEIFGNENQTGVTGEESNYES